jgi:hypothetical protein
MYDQKKKIQKKKEMGLASAVHEYESDRVSEHQQFFMIRVKSYCLEDLKYAVPQQMMQSCSDFNNYSVSVQSAEIVGSNIVIAYHFEERHNMYNRSKTYEVQLPITCKKARPSSWWRPGKPERFYVTGRWTKK